MKLKTDALVIREQHIGENDRLVTLLTREYGIIRAFASGARSIKGKLSAATQFLCFASMVLTRKNDTYRVSEAESIEMFFNLRKDLQKLSLSQYFCSLCLAFSIENDKYNEFLRIILNSLKFLEIEKYEPELIKSVTELRILSLSGYMPDLIACSGCGEYEASPMYFDLLDACLYCEDCRPAGKPGIVELTGGVLPAMRHIIYSELGKIYSFKIPEEQLRVLSDIVENYLKAHLEMSLPTLDFYNAVAKS